jgi:hypothetical protein
LLKVLVIAAIQSLSDLKVLVAQESVFHTFQTLYLVLRFLPNHVSASQTHIIKVGSIEASIHSSTHKFHFLNHPTPYLFKKFFCLSISFFQTILKVLYFLFFSNFHLKLTPFIALKSFLYLEKYKDGMLFGFNIEIFKKVIGSINLLFFHTSKCKCGQVVRGHAQEVPGIHHVFAKLSHSLINCNFFTFVLLKCQYTVTNQSACLSAI